MMGQVFDQIFGQGFDQEYNIQLCWGGAIQCTGYWDRETFENLHYDYSAFNGLHHEIIILHSILKLDYLEVYVWH